MSRRLEFSLGLAKANTAISCTRFVNVVDIVQRLHRLDYQMDSSMGYVTEVVTDLRNV